MINMMRLQLLRKLQATNIVCFAIALSIAYSNTGWAADSQTNVAIPKQTQVGAQSSSSVGPAINSSTAQPTVPVPAAEFYALQKVAVLKESQSEIIESLQTKFWIFLLVAALVGFFGIRSLIREFVASELKDAIRAAADAQAATALAKDSVKELRSEAAKYRESVEAAQQTATNLHTKLEEIRSRIEAEGDRSVAAANIKIEGVQTQIDALKSMIDNIVDRQIPGSELPKQAAEILKRAKEKTSNEEQEFSSRAGTQIAIAATGNASELGAALAARLSKLGYRVRQSIWAAQRKKSGTVAIQHMPRAAPQAETIDELLRDEFGTSVTKTSRIAVDKPVTNTNDEIILLVS